MSKQRTILKRKAWILPLGVFLLALCAWQFSLRKTINLVQENKFLRTELAKSHNAEAFLQENAQLIRELNTSLPTDSSKQVQETNILRKITEFCDAHKIIIESYQKPVIKTEKNLDIQYLPIVVKGDYKHIIQLIYFIEKAEKLGNVGHVDYSFHRDRRTRKRELLTKIFIVNTSYEKS